MSYTHEWYEKNKESLNKSSRDYYKKKRLNIIEAELFMIGQVFASLKYAGLPIEVEDYLNNVLNKKLKKLKDSKKLLTI